MPELVGLPLGVAQQKLIRAQLALGTVQPQPPNPSGKVFSQLPLAGTTVPNGHLPSTCSRPTPAAAGASKKAKAAVAAAATAVGCGRRRRRRRHGQGEPEQPDAPCAAQAGTGLRPHPQASRPTKPRQDKRWPTSVSFPSRSSSCRPRRSARWPGTVPAAGSKVPKGAHVALLVSSGSPQLAFDNGTQISVIDPTTGKVTAQVPPGVGGQVEPAWSLDGQHLVYEQDGALILVEPGVAASPPTTITTPPPGMTDRNPSFGSHRKDDPGRLHPGRGRSRPPALLRDR